MLHHAANLCAAHGAASSVVPRAYLYYPAWARRNSASKRNNGPALRCARWHHRHCMARGGMRRRPNASIVRNCAALCFSFVDRPRPQAGVRAASLQRHLSARRRKGQRHSMPTAIFFSAFLGSSAWRNSSISSKRKLSCHVCCDTAQA